ncbi:MULTISPECIES: DUF2264 domain-containing protein [Streptomycetaceae]|uniref:DUF2264 domain-containing protein n=1 Tax=Streptantibioticus cattleyicolor (strain ATCC 35852 / DSM 46488 / JCM 4925 / NBRC 14057 / NRRL 8057) TaxID=1003195 RepID=F8JRS9_STREN|nr:DUF2264 domain-containing protein [Streptantibioticus cattleyicolor]AEW97338.1 hypothetical protein SCATT_49670 [Streptantibioticus cattleyicolor NRRL 8057 = DSM 46488]MYS61789.1 DUF2264 domain-containing protein [Streptomyces sp. SID5468]CCB77661.1 conserved protein of unknown function [Streptantibioticus cattleyicolor NRRL 8057 = DSM 46488]
MAWPEEDRQRSPFTGWTRAHWEALADRLLAALVPYASPGFAQYRLPGRPSVSGALSDGLEGFARSFLLASFRIAGARGAVEPALLERYARGLAAGTDPAGGERWPPLTARSQPMVEAASIAVGLHETRPWLWDRLDDAVRQRVTDWLAGFVGNRTHDNNWRLFQVVGEEFLASVGGPHRRAEIEAGLDRVEDWYLGDGWYTDGDGRNFDHYAAWAMHLYPLLWARIAGPRADAGRVAAYRSRLRRFLDDYQHFFGADGAPVHQGRSLAYRFAAVAPVWLGALAGATPLPPGRTRRLASGAVRHFWARGVPDGRGLLTPGWYRPFPPVTQSYSGPASPYWAGKAFLGLLLPPEDPVWTAPESPLPVESGDRVTALPVPGWLLHATRADGIVRLLNHGSDHNDPARPEAATDDPHYAKLAYSTSTAPESAEHAWRHRLDGHIALVAADGTPSRRTVVRPLAVRGRRASSWYAARLPGDAADYPVATTSVVHGGWEVRVHRVRAPAGVTVREGGHAVAGDRPPAAVHGDRWALVRRADGLTSVVVGVYGWDGAGVVRHTDANAVGPCSATPWLATGRHPGGHSVHVTLVRLTGEPVDEAGTAAAARGTRVGVSGGEVTVAFADGSRLRV